MSTTPTENVSLEDRVALLQAELDRRNNVGAWYKRAWRGLVAAFGSTEAVKTEKSLGVLVGTRLLLSVGASAATIGTVHQILKQLGWV